MTKRHFVLLWLFGPLLTLALLALVCIGALDIPWVWAASPLWITPTLAALLFVLFGTRDRA